ncbi:hypothetical protein J9332_45255, partial [Aquimarina celericrescens]|nr:hypothetical protein [Aquimarina celericrescens]
LQDASNEAIKPITVIVKNTTIKLITVMRVGYGSDGVIINSPNCCCNTMSINPKSNPSKGPKTVIREA